MKDKVVMGDRLGSDVSCKHGDYFTCQDRFQPQCVSPLLSRLSLLVKASSKPEFSRRRLDS